MLKKIIYKCLKNIAKWMFALFLIFTTYIAKNSVSTIKVLLKMCCHTMHKIWHG